LLKETDLKFLKKTTVTICFLICISLLTACGGGGGSGNETQVIPDPKKADWSFKWDDGSVWQ
jgi:hypothetical protein